MKTRIRKKMFAPVVPVAKARHRQVIKRSKNAEKYQRKALGYLVKKARKTAFGKDHGFDEIESYEDFRERVPVREFDDYVDTYWQRIYAGESDVCWPGKIPYLLRTGGTTSGMKLIPTSEEHVDAVRRGAVDSGLFYTAYRGNADLFGGKQLILGGSWVPGEHPSGAGVLKVSAAGPSRTPKVLRDMFVAPGYETNCIEDFDEKLDVIAEESKDENITALASTPCWLMSFFERVGRCNDLEPGETIRKVWPDLQMCIYSGAGLGAYESVFRKWLGPEVLLWETYAATEAYVAVTDDPDEDGMLVIPDSKFFFEFIPIEDYGLDSPRRVPLWEVETDQEYAVVLSNPSGLFAYSIGDTVRFTSTSPYRLVVSGRTAFHLNTVGEHMTCEVVDQAISEAQAACGAQIRDYTVGPDVVHEDRAPGHQWLVEFIEEPADLDSFTDALDEALRKYNSSYACYRDASVIRAPELSAVPEGAFKGWVAAYKDNDPQAKVPRLKDDRGILDQVAALARALAPEALVEQAPVPPAYQIPTRALLFAERPTLLASL